MTRERLLVLAKAAPELSKKYEHTICVAGITDSGEWRRIYPVPWEVFWRDSKKKFPKKSWIEYELVSDTPSDHRPESRKINFDSIKPIGPAKFSDIESLLNERLTTVEALMEKGTTVNSLGVVNPVEVIDFKPTPNEHYQDLITRKAQKDLFGNDVIKLDIPENKYQYVYRDDVDGIRHEMLCEDWEVAELYRGCKEYLRRGRYKSEDEVHKKVREKMLDFMFSKYRKDHVRFVVGSHFLFNSYLIVSVIYPTQADMPGQVTLN